MPFINVKLIEGVFSDEEKRQVAEQLTDAMVSIKGENIRDVTWCVIEEVASGEWAVGGQLLTAAEVRGLLAADAAPTTA